MFASPDIKMNDGGAAIPFWMEDLGRVVCRIKGDRVHQASHQPHLLGEGRSPVHVDKSPFLFQFLKLGSHLPGMTEAIGTFPSVSHYLKYGKCNYQRGTRTCLHLQPQNSQIQRRSSSNTQPCLMTTNTPVPAGVDCKDIRVFGMTGLVARFSIRIKSSKSLTKGLEGP